MQRSFLIPLAIAGLSMAIPAQQPKAAEADPYLIVDGASLYKNYCAACHGLDGKGAGPAAEALKRRPPDLSDITRRSGGKFPDFRIAHIIDGEVTILAHGSREMPVWGELLPQHRDESLLRLREHNLTEYVRSLQK